MKRTSRRSLMSVLAALAALILAAAFLVGPAGAEGDDDPGSGSSQQNDGSDNNGGDNNGGDGGANGQNDGQAGDNNGDGTGENNGDGTGDGTGENGEDDSDPPSIPVGKSLVDVVAVDVQTGEQVANVMYSLNGAGQFVAPSQQLVDPGAVQVAPVLPLPAGYTITSGSYPAGQALEQQVLPLTILVEKVSGPPAQPRDPGTRVPITSVPSGRTY